MNGWRKRAVGIAVGLALVGGLAGTGGPPAKADAAGPGGAAVQTAMRTAIPAAALAQPGRSSSVSAKVTKTGKARTPKIKWYHCASGLGCATVKLPLDYDHPRGKKVEVALMRVKARKPKQRIGTLFVNPGGPGGSATLLAAYSDQVFSRAILDRFDIVGMDPRGIGFSDKVECFSDALHQIKPYRGLDVAFPYTTKERKAWVTSMKSVGKACSKNRLGTSMSTAQVARDMEMIRRALKQKQLNYFGFSYGTYLGQVYANMYPKRFRTMVIDGVIDGRAWAGTTKDRRRRPLEARLQAGAGAWTALRSILAACDQAGPATCDLAPDAYGKFNQLVKRLQAAPIKVRSLSGRYLYTLSYASLIDDLLGSMYSPAGWDSVNSILVDAYRVAIDPTLGGSDDGDDGDDPDDRLARAAGERLLVAHREAAALGPAFGFPYYNGLEAFASVTCTDSRETTKLKSYPSWQKRLAPHFGALWLWNSSICADDAFTGEDDDAYRGPFDRRTKAPVLVVGDDFDPATNIAGARSAAREMPNAKFLRSQTYGHTAYGVSDCVTSAVDQYLLSGKVRNSYATCAENPYRPYETTEEDLSKAEQLAKTWAKIRRGR